MIGNIADIYVLNIFHYNMVNLHLLLCCSATFIYPVPILKWRYDMYAVAKSVDNQV